MKAIRLLGWRSRPTPLAAMTRSQLEVEADRLGIRHESLVDTQLRLLIGVARADRLARHG